MSGSSSEWTSIVGGAMTLAAALESGLLGTLGELGVSAGELAARLGLDARATAQVLDVLVADGLAQRDAGRYAATPRLLQAARELPREQALWRHLYTYLRTGQPLTRSDGEPLLGSYAKAARALARWLPRSVSNVLDVGCGAGVWGLAVCERFAESWLTGLDRLDVLTDAFLPRAASLGLTSRVEILPGDPHTLALPQRWFDLALVAGGLRAEPEARAQALVRRVAGALAPGGELVVVDALASSTPAYPLDGLRCAVGRVHTAETIAGWLEAAGLKVEGSVDLGDHAATVGALRARKDELSLELPAVAE